MSTKRPLSCVFNQILYEPPPQQGLVDPHEGPLHHESWSLMKRSLMKRQWPIFETVVLPFQNGTTPSFETEVLPFRNETTSCLKQDWTRFETSLLWYRSASTRQPKFLLSARILNSTPLISLSARTFC